MSPEAYRSFGFPGADDLVNMFQFKRDFNRYFVAARDLGFTRTLNPALQTFEKWLAEHKDQIPLPARSAGRSVGEKMRRTQLVHLARVAESAATELPDIAQKFRLTREAVPYLAFRTAARGMSAEAQNQKETWSSTDSSIRCSRACPNPWTSSTRR